MNFTLNLLNRPTTGFKSLVKNFGALARPNVLKLRQIFFTYKSFHRFDLLGLLNVYPLDLFCKDTVAVFFPSVLEPCKDPPF